LLVRVGRAGATTWETAVAHLAVAPGPDAHPDQETVLGAQLDEPPQVAPAGPVERPLGLLMVDPEHIRRHNSDTAGLHLEELRFPLRRGSANSELAHHWKPRLAVDVSVRELARPMPGGRLAADGEGEAARRRRCSAGIGSSIRHATGLNQERRAEQTVRRTARSGQDGRKP